MNPSEERPLGHEAASLEGATDQSLLDRFRGGVDHAATLLYFRYADHLLSLTTARLGRDLTPRLDPEDIVQSVFRTFFRRAALGQFEVPQGGDLWKLFLVLALNKIRNAGAHHRAARRDVRRTADAADEPATPARPDDSLTVLRLVVEDVLDGLPPTARPIVELRVEGHEVAEIAGRTGRSVRSVERVLRDFRARMVASLGAGGET